MYLLQYLLRSYDSKNRYLCSCGRWNFLWADEGNIFLPPWPPQTPLMPWVLAMVSSTWRTCVFFQRPETGPNKRQQNPQDKRTLGFELIPSGFVILSCKTKAFQVVLSKYGKSLVLSTQRVHPDMACGIGEPQHATSVLGRTQNTGYLRLSCQKSKGKIPSLLTFMICRQTQLLCWR